MNLLILILAIVASALLIIIVLIQNPKGGGLASEFGSASQLGGVKRTTDFLEKATWTLAIVIAALSLLSAMYSKSPATNGEQQVETTNAQQNTGGNNGGGNTLPGGGGGSLPQ